MRLLVVTHTFPPSDSSNAKRPYYVVKALLDAGWQVDVFTSTFGMKAGQPESVAHPALRIFRPTDALVQLLGTSVKRQGLFRAAALAANGLMWPDGFAFWALRALRTCRRSGDYDRVLAFVLPASVLLCGIPSHLVGSHWVFDYQESVTPQFRRHLRRSPLQRMLVPLLAKLERRTLHKAGRVIFTADVNRRTYVHEGLVEERMTAHVPYFFDAAVFKKPANQGAVSAVFEITYFGTFDWRGERSPETFLQSLAQFLGSRPEARPHTRFQFYGSWLPEHNHYLDELNLRDVVCIKPAVQYEEYLQKLRQSPILLLVVASAHNLFMPSKIVDYFGAQRPIMAFVPSKSEMRSVLEKAGMADFACDETDVPGGVAALERLWARYQSKALDCPTDKTHFWSSEVQIPRYVEILRRPSF